MDVCLYSVYIHAWTTQLCDHPPPCKWTLHSLWQPKAVRWVPLLHFGMLIQWRYFLKWYQPNPSVNHNQIHQLQPRWISIFQASPRIYLTIIMGYSDSTTIWELMSSLALERCWRVSTSSSSISTLISKSYPESSCHTSGHIGSQGNQYLGVAIFQCSDPFWHPLVNSTAIETTQTIQTTKQFSVRILILLL